jgi:uncharacterized membrane protein
MGLHPRHRRFFAALTLGVASGAILWAVPLGLTVPARALIPANLFFLAYLAASLRFAAVAGPAVLQAEAASEDEGIALILCLAAAALGVSLTGIVLVMNAKAGSVGTVETCLALASVPLAWGMIHMVAAFRYAHLHYATKGGGLALPDDTTPEAWDFIYFAYGIGMTAQVADITLRTPRLRRTVTLHAIAAFFTNTIILALAVNAAVAVGG